jgi:hypothetical protein
MYRSAGRDHRRGNSLLYEAGLSITKKGFAPACPDYAFPMKASAGSK